MNIEVSNFEYCRNDSEFLSFMNDEGEILQTYKMTGEDLRLYMPSNTTIIESASMEIYSSVPQIENNNINNIEYNIDVDYKKEEITVKLNSNYDSISSSNNQNEQTFQNDKDEKQEKEEEKEESNNIKPLKDKYSNINYEEILNNGFKVQGLTKIDNTILITCYDEKNNHAKKRNSRIYLYDSITGKSKGYIILNTSSHVGGISFDKDNGILYISSSLGQTLTFDLSNKHIVLLRKILNENTIIDLSSDNVDKRYNVAIDNNIKVDTITDVGRNSTMYSDGKYIYVATFNEKAGYNGEVVKFKITNIRDGFYYKCSDISYWINKNIHVEQVYKSVIPDYTQGVLSVKYNNETYIITSQSYSNSKSTLTVQKEKNNRLVYIGSNVINHPGIESLHIDDYGKIICIFENGSCSIYETNIKELLTSLDSNNSVRKAQKEQMIYNNIDQAYKNIKRDINTCYKFNDITLKEIWTIIMNNGLLDFIIGIFKNIPDAYYDLIEINSDFIDITLNAGKVVPKEFKLMFSK